MMAVLPLHRVDDCLIVTMPAGMDLACAGVVNAELASAVETAPPEGVILDLRQTRHCDSWGVQVLLRAHHQGAAIARPVRLVVGVGPVWAAVHSAGADQLLWWYPDLSQALRAADPTLTGGSSPQARTQGPAPPDPGAHAVSGSS